MRKVPYHRYPSNTNLATEAAVTVVVEVSTEGSNDDDDATVGTRAIAELFVTRIPPPIPDADASDASG